MEHGMEAKEMWAHYEGIVPTQLLGNHMENQGNVKWKLRLQGIHGNIEGFTLS